MNKTKQECIGFCLLFLVLAATCASCVRTSRVKSNGFRSILTRWSYRLGNKSQMKQNQMEREAVAEEANKYEKQEEERRMFFRKNIESRLVASAILRDFYAGRFR